MYDNLLPHFELTQQINLAVGKEDAAVEDYVDKYRESRGWLSTVEDVMVLISSREREDPHEAFADIMEWSKWNTEHTDTVTLMDRIHQWLINEHPEKLAYFFRRETLEGDMVNGESDDSPEITHQFAAVNPISKKRLTRTKVVATGTTTRTHRVTLTMEDVHGHDEETYEPTIGGLKKRIGFLAAANKLDKKYKIDPNNPNSFTSRFSGGKASGTVEISETTYKTTRSSFVVETEETEAPIASQAAGPEYYPATGAYPKDERSLKSTIANHEARVWRKERYQDDDFSLPTKASLVPMHPDLLTVMRSIWRRANKNELVTIGSIRKSLGPIVDNYTGEVKKPASPLINSIGHALLLLRKKGFIDLVGPNKLTVCNEEGNISESHCDEVYILCISTGPGSELSPKRPIDEYTMRLMNINYEVDFGSYRAAIQCQQYLREGTWHPRVGIMVNPTNAKEPLYVDGVVWEPKTKYNDDSVKYEDGYTRIYRRIVDGGIPFYGTAQLHPEVGADYDQSGRYSFRSSWSEVIRDVFLRRLQSGHLNSGNVRGGICISPSGIKNGQPTYKRQAWMVVRLPKGTATFEGKDDGRYVVVFADVKDTRPVRGHWHTSTLKHSTEEETKSLANPNNPNSSVPESPSLSLLPTPTP